MSETPDEARRAGLRVEVAELERILKVRQKELDALDEQLDPTHYSLQRNLGWRGEVRSVSVLRWMKGRWKNKILREVAKFGTEPEARAWIAQQV